MNTRKEVALEEMLRVLNTLIDMYVKCGCLEEARRVFNEMEERTVVSCPAMIQGLAMNGLAMHERHMGLVDECHRFFSGMTRNYGIIPEIEHFGSMVDLFSRAGLLQEAHEYIMNMHIKPNGVV
ncbi:hypothetical protein CRYUN_Cryun39dG0006100 [Craigia yunnanensis]